MQVKQLGDDRTTPETRRPYVSKVRLSTAENDALRDAAEKAGLSIGGYIRAACLGSPGVRAVRHPTVDHRLIAHVLGRVGRIGGNVNSLAFIGHLSGELPTRSDLKEAVDGIRDIRATLMRALGRQP